MSVDYSALLIRGVSISDEELARIDEDSYEYLRNEGWLLFSDEYDDCGDAFIGYALAKVYEGKGVSVDSTYDESLTEPLEEILQDLHINRAPTLWLVQMVS